MQHFVDITDEELKAELKRREEKRKQESIPQQKKNIDWEPLLNYVHLGITRIVESDGHPGKDFDHYVFETVMECIYGKDIWKWWNANANY